MQCGFVGELLLSMHKTLDSFPWTTIETYLNGSDVQPGLEVTLSSPRLVFIPVLGWITSSSSISFPNSPSEMEVGFVRLLLFEKRKNSLE